MGTPRKDGTSSLEPPKMPKSARVEPLDNAVRQAWVIIQKRVVKDGATHVEASRQDGATERAWTVEEAAQTEYLFPSKRVRRDAPSLETRANRAYETGKKQIVRDRKKDAGAGAISCPLLVEGGGFSDE